MSVSVTSVTKNRKLCSQFLKVTFRNNCRSRTQVLSTVSKAQEEKNHLNFTKHETQRALLPLSLSLSPRNEYIKDGRRLISFFPASCSSGHLFVLGHKNAKLYTFNYYDIIRWAHFFVVVAERTTNYWVNSLKHKDNGRELDSSPKGRHLCVDSQVWWAITWWKVSFFLAESFCNACFRSEQNMFQF